MINQLEAIGAGRAPEGYLLKLDIENLIESKVWINTKPECVKLEFDWCDRYFISHELKIEKDFGHDQFDALYKCIEDFKTFARAYL